MLTLAPALLVAILSLHTHILGIFSLWGKGLIPSTKPVLEHRAEGKMPGNEPSRRTTMFP